jgi:hypothetical protein
MFSNAMGDGVTSHHEVGAGGVGSAGSSGWGAKSVGSI